MWTIVKIGLWMVAGAVLVKENEKANRAYESGKSKIRGWFEKHEDLDAPVIE